MSGLFSCSTQAVQAVHLLLQGQHFAIIFPKYICTPIFNDLCKKINIYIGFKTFFQCMIEFYTK